MFTRLAFILMSLLKNQKSVHVWYGCGSNFTEKNDKSSNNIIIKHVDRRIKEETEVGNLLFNADFIAAYYRPIKSHIRTKK